MMWQSWINYSVTFFVVDVNKCFLLPTVTVPDTVLTYDKKYPERSSEIPKTEKVGELPGIKSYAFVLTASIFLFIIF